MSTPETTPTTTPVTNNPETLKYNINDVVSWMDVDDSTIHTGVVHNIRYDVLDVIEDGNKLVFVPYHKILPEGV